MPKMLSIAEITMRTFSHALKTCKDLFPVSEFKLVGFPRPSHNWNCEPDVWIQPDRL